MSQDSRLGDVGGQAAPRTLHMRQGNTCATNESAARGRGYSNRPIDSWSRRWRETVMPLASGTHHLSKATGRGKLEPQTDCSNFARSWVACCSGMVSRLLRLAAVSKPVWSSIPPSTAWRATGNRCPEC